jgi:hypothetical protein
MRAVVLAALVTVVWAGCGGAPAEVASVEMALAPSSGLSPSDVGAVEILVFDGASGGCARVLTGVSPLDDSGLALVAHALFTIDGTPKHMAIPAGKALDFYAEAFGTAAPGRMRIGRGCVMATLAAGSSAPVSISISASP